VIWLWLLLVAAVTAGGIVWFGRVPAAARPLAAAAVMLGLAGYALQGSPALPGKPVAAHEEPDGFGEAITDRRQGMADRFGPAAQWLAMSDGFARTGKTALAAQTLEKGLQKYPDNVDLWVGLGNALVAHGGGMTRRPPPRLPSTRRRSAIRPTRRRPSSPGSRWRRAATCAGPMRCGAGFSPARRPMRRGAPTSKCGWTSCAARWGRSCRPKPGTGRDFDAIRPQRARLKAAA